MNFSEFVTATIDEASDEQKKKKVQDHTDRKTVNQTVHSSMPPWEPNIGLKSPSTLDQIVSKDESKDLLKRCCSRAKQSPENEP